jgi:hypothetical protein
MQAWGSGAAMPPQTYVVPNVTFAEPYAQYPQRQQSIDVYYSSVAHPQCVDGEFPST